MLENIMGNDELADAFKSLFDQTHANVEALADGAVKNRARRLLAIMHAAANALKDHAVDSGVIQPFSGGDPKPE